MDTVPCVECAEEALGRDPDLDRPRQLHGLRTRGASFHAWCGANTWSPTVAMLSDPWQRKRHGTLGPSSSDSEDGDGMAPAAVTKRQQQADMLAAGDALLQLGLRLYRLEIEALGSIDPPLTLRQFRILDRVDHGIASMTQLASLARRRLPTISKSADSLVRQGLLTRVTSSADRRVASLQLTPAGREVLDRARAALTELANWAGKTLLASTADLGVTPKEFVQSFNLAYDAAADLLRSDAARATHGTDGSPGSTSLAASRRKVR